ncbi:hypothetical protein [Sodalis sp. RH16]|uniref:hypothetical protein n=1 Tax=Sodalis sp. RH16 TaxID=3394331 RepID=UPI0039B37566
MINIRSSLSAQTVTINYSDPETLRTLLWQIWENEARPGQGEKRSIAVQRMMECERNDSNILDLSSLGLTSLPPVLPKKHQILYIHDNQLSDITPVLAPNLMELNASDNRLTILPDMNNHYKLKSLNVSHNHLTVLSNNLPPALEILNIGNNRLKKLPQLPLFLVEFDAHNNDLMNFDEALPATLQFLDLRNNRRLTRLPAKMQQQLIKLFVSGPRSESKISGSPIDLKKFFADERLFISIFGNVPSTLKL